MNLPAQTAHSATAFAIAGWIVSVATDALPVVQACAGLAAFVASCYGIAWYRKNLKERARR